VKHEANGKDGIKRLALQGERLAVTLDQCQRDSVAIRGAAFTPCRAHHLKRDISANKLQLSMQQPGEESPGSTWQVKTAADGWTEGGGHVEGTLDRRQCETIAFLTPCRQEA
jgi:hypothetical protein